VRTGIPQMLQHFAQFLARRQPCSSSQLAFNPLNQPPSKQPVDGSNPSGGVFKIQSETGIQPKIPWAPWDLSGH